MLRITFRRIERSSHKLSEMPHYLSEESQYHRYFDSRDVWLFWFSYRPEKRSSIFQETFLFRRFLWSTTHGCFYKLNWTERHKSTWTISCVKINFLREFTKHRVGIKLASYTIIKHPINLLLHLLLRDKVVLFNWPSLNDAVLICPLRGIPFAIRACKISKCSYDI